MTAVADPGPVGAVERAVGAGAEGQLFSVPDLHCAGCIAKVERTLSRLEGVTAARVNLSLRRVSVRGDCTADAITEALGNAGYAAHALDTAALEDRTDPVGRDLLLRLAVAGFAMMNVMLLSVAVWSGAADATRELFHLISAAIALPVVVFSARPFFDHAWRALRAGGLNMDVPISVAILLAAGMSLFEALNGGADAYFDAALSLTFFLLVGRYLDHRTRGAARSAAAELAALEANSATRLQGAVPEVVAIRDLAVGDRVQVATGGRVPVDGRLEREAITDCSFLTGESDPVARAAGQTVQAGEVNLGPALLLRATAVGQDTTLQRMAALVDLAEGARNRYTTLADRAARIYAPAVHLLGLLAFLGWWWGTGDVRLSLNIAIAVLIITCPCALGLAVPAVSSAAIGRLYSLGYLVKSGTALERLAEVDTIVFDKTGTLTLPRIAAEGTDLPASARGVALALARSSDHPVARAVVAAFGAQPAAVLSDVSETPGQGVSARRNGELVQLGRSEWLGAGTQGFGLRIGDQCWPIARTEALRPGAAAAVARLRAQGLQVMILSGDRTDAVQAIARDLGIGMATGGLTAQEKHARLDAMAAQGRKVAMIGDGLNDAAALAAAQASIAPAGALDVTRTAADIVVLREDITDLPLVLATARAARRLSIQNFAIAAAYNLVAIPVALSGFATPLLAALAMSASSLTVLANAMRVRRAR